MRRIDGFALKAVALVVLNGIASTVPVEWRTAESKGDLLAVGSDLSIPPSQLPAIGNGFLASQISSGRLFVAGVYNGRAGAGASSHRAAVPCDICAQVAPGFSSDAALDLRQGAMYRRRSYVAPENGGARQYFACTPRLVADKASRLLRELGPSDGRGEFTTWLASCAGCPDKLWLEERLYAHGDPALRSVLVHELAALGPAATAFKEGDGAGEALRKAASDAAAAASRRKHSAEKSSTAADAVTSDVDVDALRDWSATVGPTVYVLPEDSPAAGGSTSGSRAALQQLLSSRGAAVRALLRPLVRHAVAQAAGGALPSDGLIDRVEGLLDTVLHSWLPGNPERMVLLGGRAALFILAQAQAQVASTDDVTPGATERAETMQRLASEGVIIGQGQGQGQGPSLRIDDGAAGITESAAPLLLRGATLFLRALASAYDQEPDPGSAASVGGGDSSSGGDNAAMDTAGGGMTVARKRALAAASAAAATLQSRADACLLPEATKAASVSTPATAAADADIDLLVPAAAAVPAHTVRWSGLRFLSGSGASPASLRQLAFALRRPLAGSLADDAFHTAQRILMLASESPIAVLTVGRALRPGAGVAPGEAGPEGRVTGRGNALTWEAAARDDWTADELHLGGQKESQAAAHGFVDITDAVRVAAAGAPGKGSRSQGTRQAQAKAAEAPLQCPALLPTLAAMRRRALVHRAVGLLSLCADLQRVTESGADLQLETAGRRGLGYWRGREEHAFTAGIRGGSNGGSDSAAALLDGIAPWSRELRDLKAAAGAGAAAFSHLLGTPPSQQQHLTADAARSEDWLPSLRDILSVRFSRTKAGETVQPAVGAASSDVEVERLTLVTLTTALPATPLHDDDDNYRLYGSAAAGRRQLAAAAAADAAAATSWFGSSGSGSGVRPYLSDAGRAGLLRQKGGRTVFTAGSHANGTAAAVLRMAHAGDAHVQLMVVRSSLEAPPEPELRQWWRSRHGSSEMPPLQLLQEAWLLEAACEDYALALQRMREGTLQSSHIAAWQPPPQPQGPTQIDGAATQSQRMNGGAEVVASGSPSPSELPPPFMTDPVWSSGIELTPASPSAAEAVLRLGRILNTSLHSLAAFAAPGWPMGSSPGGLSTAGYGGRQFWDYDTFTFPAALLMAPATAHASLRYRLHRLPGARAKARSYEVAAFPLPPPADHDAAGSRADAGQTSRGAGTAGAMWPWESGLTGVEAGPDWAPTAKHEIHIAGDVALSVWQAWLALPVQHHDGEPAAASSPSSLAWLREVAFPLLAETADFWLDRALADTAKLLQKQASEVAGMSADDLLVRHWNWPHRDAAASEKRRPGGKQPEDAARQAVGILCGDAAAAAHSATGGRHSYLCRAALGAVRLAPHSAASAPACVALADSGSESVQGKGRNAGVAAAARACVAALLAIATPNTAQPLAKTEPAHDTADAEAVGLQEATLRSGKGRDQASMPAQPGSGRALLEAGNSRPSTRTVFSQLHIAGVIPPTEHYSDKTDSTFTNAGAKLALLHAAAAAQVLGLPAEVWQPWAEAGARLAVPFVAGADGHGNVAMDEQGPGQPPANAAAAAGDGDAVASAGVHPYFSGFPLQGATVQCLDVPMLWWPLGITDASPAAVRSAFHVSRRTFLRDLAFYTRRQDGAGSVAFAWALNAILASQAAAAALDEGWAQALRTSGGGGARDGDGDASTVSVAAATAAWSSMLSSTASAGGGDDSSQGLADDAGGLASASRYASQAAGHLVKSYSDFVHGPFAVWQEYAGGGGVSNFVTGAGAILEAALFGYARIALHGPGAEVGLLAGRSSPLAAGSANGQPEHESTYALTLRPSLLPGTASVVLRSIAYAGARLRVAYTGEEVTVTLLTCACPEAAASAAASTTGAVSSSAAAVGSLMSSTGGLWSLPAGADPRADPRSSEATVASAFAARPWLRDSDAPGLRQSDLTGGHGRCSAGGAALKISRVMAVHLQAALRPQGAAGSSALLQPWQQLECGKPVSVPLSIGSGASAAALPAPPVVVVIAQA